MGKIYKEGNDDELSTILNSNEYLRKYFNTFASLLPLKKYQLCLLLA